MKKSAIVFLCILCLSFVSINYSFAQVSSQWRGPERNGVYPATDLLKHWPETGPELKWHFDELGEGHTSAAVTEKMVYITGMIEEKGVLFALSHDGKVQWKTEYGPEWAENFPGTRSTPRIEGDRIYLMSGKGLLLCIHAFNGNILWKIDLIEQFEGRNITWGMTESIEIDGKKLFCTPGGTKHNIVAIERFTGKTIWTSPANGEVSAYCSPLLVQHDKGKVLVTHTADNIVGLNPENGEMYWKVPHPNQWSVHPNTPLYYNGYLFCFSGYGQGGECLQLSDDGTKVTEAWKNKTLDNQMGGAVVIDGFIYGAGQKDRTWQCLDIKTGEIKYKASDIKEGVIISADNMLYHYSNKGEMALSKINPEKFELISKFKIELGSGQHWAHPVIHKGVLFVRHGNSLMAYNIAK